MSGWTEPVNVTAFVAGGLGLVAFAMVETRTAHPLVDLGWARRPPVSGAAVVAFCAKRRSRR